MRNSLSQLASLMGVALVSVTVSNPASGSTPKEFVVIADLESISDPKGLPCSTAYTVETRRYRVVEDVCGNFRVRPGRSFTVYAPCPRGADPGIGDRHVLLLSPARECEQLREHPFDYKMRGRYCAREELPHEDYDLEDLKTWCW